MCSDFHHQIDTLVLILIVMLPESSPLTAGFTDMNNRWLGCRYWTRFEIFSLYARASHPSLTELTRDLIAVSVKIGVLFGAYELS